MHLKQWLMIGTLTGGAVLTALSTGGQAVAASANGGGGGAQINGTTIWTSISYSEPGAQSGWSSTSSNGWTPPPCWLEPWPGGFGVSPGDTPTEFAQFMTMLDGYAEDQGNGNNPDGGAAQWEALYQNGQGDDRIVDMIAPPYNQGVGGGEWYGIACSTSATWSDQANFIASLNLNNPYEFWFWIPNGRPPAGVPVVNEAILAEYAASKLTVPTLWPTSSPPLGDKQTVNLATELTNAAGANLYKKYTVTATLPLIAGMTTHVTATPASITIKASPSGAMKPASEKCNFAASGALAAGCDLNFEEASNAHTAIRLTAQVTWNVVWGGDAAAGEAGWTKQMTVNLPQLPVTVQEIQTIVVPGDNG
jgi:hypothetical protein